MSAIVSSLIHYPLKSGRGNKTESMEMTGRGPKNDRMWMLVDNETGVQISQRDTGCEKMALIESHVLDNGSIRFSAPGMPPVTWEGEGYLISNVSVHGDKFVADFEGYVIASWFREYLGRSCDLVSYNRSRKGRKVDPEYSREGDEVSFADGFPLLVTSTSSLDVLRDHFSENVNIGMDQFRPNIVIDGLEPFEEDIVYTMGIGGIELEFTKPCLRCILTTVNQELGKKITANEPMGTLVKTRRGKGEGLQGVFFGQNAIPRALGTINVGDEVEVLSTRELHPAVKMAKVGFEP